jgi:hypothetical protein
MGVHPLKHAALVTFRSGLHLPPSGQNLTLGTRRMKQFAARYQHFRRTQVFELHH